MAEQYNEIREKYEKMLAELDKKFKGNIEEKIKKKDELFLNYFCVETAKVTKALQKKTDIDPFTQQKEERLSKYFSQETKKEEARQQAPLRESVKRQRSPRPRIVS